MTSIVRHILLRILSLFLIYALLLPFAVKLDHVFENHEHRVCNSTVESHIHDSEFECDFLNYKINQVGYASFASIKEVVVHEHVAKNFVLQNTFYQNEKVTSFLRGPPSLA